LRFISSRRIYLIEAQKKTIHPQRRWINVTAQ